jgi:hypothetical protein
MVFASKWMIYQGIIESGTEPGNRRQLWRSGLDLQFWVSPDTASFIKFIGGIYLGRKKPAFEITEAPVIMDSSGRAGLSVCPFRLICN